jgi:non-heme chloroperoxidase
MSTHRTSDGVALHYDDWGRGQPVVFSHGWPLCGDAFEDQMIHLAGRGLRVIAHDRRGHGRSDRPYDGNTMDTYADDLAGLLDHLKLTGVVLVGHNAGGGEVSRYVGRHGTGRVAKVVLIGAVPPRMLRAADNPAGLPVEVFDATLAGVRADRARYFRDLALPYFGYNRRGTRISQGVCDGFWRQAMMAGMPACTLGVRALSEADFTDDLRRIDVPTLILHGDDDQIVPIQASAYRTAQIVPACRLIVYRGGDHGLCTTHKERVNADLWDFITGTAGGGA